MSDSETVDSALLLHYHEIKRGVLKFALLGEKLIVVIRLLPSRSTAEAGKKN
jgi:hypothetical protein